MGFPTYFRALYQDKAPNWEIFTLLIEFKRKKPMLPDKPTYNASFLEVQRQFARIARLLLRSHVLRVLLGGAAQVLLAAQKLTL